MNAEAAAAGGLARQGQLVRLWKPPVAPGANEARGLCRAGSEADLDVLLAALPLGGWMHVAVTPLEPHANDSASPRPSSFQLPDSPPGARLPTRGDAGDPIELGDTGHGFGKGYVVSATSLAPALS